MLRLVCPKCQKDSYSSGADYFNPCPYCGFIFSGKYGSDKRHEGRDKQEIPFVFPYQGEHLEATTVDFSEKGLGIEILGEPPIAIGDTINIFIGDLQVRAKVMWVTRLPDKSLSGLRRLN